MHKIELVVRVLEHGEAVAGYARDLELPFVPTAGMRFMQGSSTTVWETRNGTLYPKVEQVIYDLDEEKIVCLFTVEERLAASFWTELKLHVAGTICAEMRYFEGE